MKPCSVLLTTLILIASLPAGAQNLDRAGVRVPSSAGAERGADLAEARRAFERGKRAFEAGRYEEAAERFEHAYEQSGLTDLLFNLGLAFDRLREDERALAAFERYLELSEDDELRAQVEQRVAALRTARARAREAEARRKDEESGATAPSPAQVAASAQPRGTAPASGPERTGPADTGEADDDGGVLSSWWFWTGAALVLASGATAAFVLTRETDAEPLPRPNTGVAVGTLRLAP